MSQVLTKRGADLTPEGIRQATSPVGPVTPDRAHNRRRLGVIVVGLFLIAFGTAGVIAVCLHLAGLLPEKSLLGIKHAGWPLLIMLVGGIAVLISWPRPAWGWVLSLRAYTAWLGQQWQSQGLLGRCLIVTILLHAVISVGYLLNAPETLIQKYQEQGMLTKFPSQMCGGATVANLDFFLEQCRKEIPERANAVYRGHWEAMVAAYRLYPRRLYFLPEDAYRLAGAWNKHRWLEIATKGASRADDGTDSYWLSRRIPPRFSAEEQARFFAERDITHLIEFNEEQPGLCRIKRIPTRDGEP